MTPKKAGVPEIVLYLVPLTAMYYLSTQYVDVGFHLMYKGVMGLVVIALALLRFLIQPDLGRMKKLGKASALLILPNLVITVWSLFSWAVSFTSPVDISRGLSSQIYQIIAVLAMAGVLYALGENGIWYNLMAMLAANLIVIAQVVSKSGLSAYLLELKETVLSFAAQTGGLMKSTEVHELTFAIGLYLVQYLLFAKQAKKFWLLAPLTLFCYLSGFKRIGVVALVLAVVCGWLLSLNGKNAKRLSRTLKLLGVGIVALAFCYIVLIRQGLFTALAERFSIDTMGRSDLYDAIRPYYSLSPFFMGQGAGFVSRLFLSSGNAYLGEMGALHNDFLQIYVDIGFTGFLLWGFSLTAVRTALISKQSTEKIACFCLTLYCIVTYATDNTYYYPYVTSAAAILIMGNLFSERGAAKAKGAERIGYEQIDEHYRSGL